METEINFEDLVLENNKSLETPQETIEFTSFEDLSKSELEENLEKKEVETKEETKIEEKKEDVKLSLDFSDKKDYSSIAKKFLENNDWEDALLEIDGKEVKLSEIENLDEDTFMSVWEEQKKISKENIDKEYIPVKGIDENKLKLINIIKSGGDLKQIFADESQLQRPFENANLDDQGTQQQILYRQYLNQGIEAEDAKELVIKSTKDLTLDAKVIKIVEFHQKNYDETLSKLETETKEAAKQEIEKVKEYKKSLTTLYKEEGLDDSLSKVLSEAATKIDKESGQLYIDTVYEKLMEDPKKAKDLIFFMLEQEKFLAQKGAKIKKDADVSVLRKVNIIRDSAKTSNKAKEEEEKTNSIFEFALPVE